MPRVPGQPQRRPRPHAPLHLQPRAGRAVAGHEEAAAAAQEAQPEADQVKQYNSDTVPSQLW